MYQHRKLGVGVFRTGSIALHQRRHDFIEQQHKLTPTGEGSGNNYAYLVTDDKSKQAVIIDPANPSEYVPATTISTSRR